MDARFTGPMLPHNTSKSVVEALKGKLRTKIDLYWQEVGDTT
jgi:hypothetical protein